jgi:hypothetical protein
MSLLGCDSVRAQLSVIELNQSQRALVWRDAHLAYVVGPGRHAFWIKPCAVTIEVHDVSEIRLEHPRLEEVIRHADTCTLFSVVNVGCERRTAGAARRGSGRDARPRASTCSGRRRTTSAGRSWSDQEPSRGATLGFLFEHPGWCKQKGDKYIIVLNLFFRGRPRGRRVDCNPSRVAACFSQVGVPKGRPRWTARRRASVPPPTGPG